MATERIGRFDGYGVPDPDRGVVDKLLTAADKVSANCQAVHDIRQFCERAHRENGGTGTVKAEHILNILARHHL